MKRNHLLLYLVACVILFSSTACSNDDLIEETELVSETQIKHPHRIMSNLNPKDYNVNIDMVKGYLRLTKRIDDMRSITPLTIYQDTLAWAVQYQKGWQVLSGDSRLAPVMISSEESELDLKEQSPNTNAVNGLLYYIKDIHYGADTLKNRVWKFLETSDLYQKKPHSPRRIGGEIMTRGMWVAVDSSYEHSTSTQPHIINTKWWEGEAITWNNYAGPYYNMPWNGFTPTINNKHTLIGCVAVAACQLIYHYRQNYSRGIVLPSDGSVSGSDAIPVFMFDTINVWSNMAHSLYDPNKIKVKNVALFLSYLGSQIGSNYGLGGTTAGTNKIADILNEYLLDFDTIHSYNYSIVDNNLTCYKPVGIVSSTTDNVSHTFIIDSKREEMQYYQVTYVWDNDYEVDYYEYNRFEPWRFEMPDDYDPLLNNEVYCFDTIDQSLTVSFAMNWGWWDGKCNNNYYSACITDYIIDQYGGIYAYTSFEFVPYWAADGHNYNCVTRLVYNIHEH